MTTISTSQLATLIYRRLTPSSRIHEQIKYVRNGGTTKQYGCALCGACSPTWCGGYRTTKQVLVWCDTHRESDCALRYVSAHLEVASDLGYALVDGTWVLGGADLAGVAVAYYPQSVAA